MSKEWLGTPTQRKKMKTWGEQLRSHGRIRPSSEERSATGTHVPWWTILNIYIYVLWRVKPNINIPWYTIGNVCFLMNQNQYKCLSNVHNYLRNNSSKDPIVVRLLIVMDHTQYNVHPIFTYLWDDTAKDPIVVRLLIVMNHTQYNANPMFSCSLTLETILPRIRLW